MSRSWHPGGLRRAFHHARERKQLISEITATIDQQARTAALTIYWEGGASTIITAALPRLGAPERTTDTSIVDLVRRLAEIRTG